VYGWCRGQDDLLEYLNSHQYSRSSSTRSSSSWSYRRVRRPRTPTLGRRLEKMTVFTYTIYLCSRPQLLSHPSSIIIRLANSHNTPSLDTTQPTRTMASPVITLRICHPFIYAGLCCLLCLQVLGFEELIDIILQNHSDIGMW
jgi:hypothetical protein